MKILQRWWRKREEKRYTYQQMHNEYRATYKKMRSYLSVKGINEIAFQEITNEIMSMCIEGEARKIPLEDIFGENIEAFCDEISKNAIRKSITEYLFHYLRNVMVLISTYCFLAVIYQVLGLTDGQFIDVYHIQLKEGDYRMLINSFFIVLVYSLLLPRFELKKAECFNIIIIVLGLLCFFATLMFMKYTLPETVTVPYLLIFCILLATTSLLCIIDKVLTKKHYAASKKDIY